MKDLSKPEKKITAEEQNGVLVGNESTKQENWKPTPAMRVWLDVAIQSDNDDISSLAKECGLDRKNWYNWIKDDNFLLWYKTEWDKRLSSQSWRLDKIGLRKARTDHKYWESMQKRVGNLTDQPKSLQQINVGGKDGNTITFVNFKDESKG